MQYNIEYALCNEIVTNVLNWLFLGICRKNGEDDVDDDTDYVYTDVPEKDITDNDTVGSNENDDGYDVEIDDDEDDDDGSDWCFYWDCGCFLLSPCY